MVFYPGLSPQPCIQGPAKTVDIFTCTTVTAKNNDTSNEATIYFKNCSDNSNLIFELGLGSEFTFCSYNGAYGISSGSLSSNVTFTVVSYCSEGISCGEPVITQANVSTGKVVDISFSASATSSTSYFFAEASSDGVTWNGYGRSNSVSPIQITLTTPCSWQIRISHYCDGKFIKYSAPVTINVCDCAINITTCEVVYDCGITIDICEELPPVLDCSVNIIICEEVAPSLDCSVVIDICEEVSSQNVTGVFGSMEPCIGGTIDDHMGAL